MTEKVYSNNMITETRSTVSAFNQFNITQTFDYFASCVPQEVFDKTRHVLLTGCGDSYCTALAAKPVFENIDRFDGTGIYPGLPTDALRSIEMGRYYNTYRGWDPLRKDQYMICGVSISGNPYRPIESLMRINELGGTSIAFTNNDRSRIATEAKYVIDLHCPNQLHLDNVPNVITYEASMFSLMMFGLFTGVKTGRLAMEEALERRASVMSYINSFTASVMKDIEEKVQAICEKWESAGVDFYDYVAEDQEYATAFFGSAKVVEGIGALTTHDDAEDWSHINYYNREPSKVGTVVVCNMDSPSFNRDVETIAVMLSIGRPTMVVTDAPESFFPEGADVISLPKAKYRWASPLMQHLPLDYVCAYLQVLQNEIPFRRGSEIHMRDQGRRFKSEIKIEL